MMTHAAYDCDVLVIGGGIVGLSTAYALTRAAPGTRVTVLEKESGPARHQTGRNSGVIHSGIYYRPGSLKARYALRGSAELADFCAEHAVAHATTGKLIVATDRSELPRLHSLVQRGREHGLPVRELGPAQIAEYEPEVRGLAAIRVNTTGVCDFTAVAHRLAAEVGAAGGIVRYGAEVTAIDRRPWGVAVRTADGPVVRARTLVNCAGCTATGWPASPGTTRGCGSCRSGASTTRWTAPSWCAAWSIRCRTRHSRSSASTSPGGSTARSTSGRTRCPPWPARDTPGRGSAPPNCCPR